MVAHPIHVLDDFYLSITLLVTIGYQLIFFSVAFALKFDKLTDFAGGSNFILLAALTLGLSSSGNGYGSSTHPLPDTRQVVASVFLMVWALRLAGFLLFRVLRTGKDDRFDDKRDKLLPFLGFWTFQAVWVWTVSLPVTLLNSPAVRGLSANQPAFGTGRDIAGTVLFAVGFVMEAGSDAQKFAFRERNLRDHGGAEVLNSGFFYTSRHPNYFGEMLVQFGIYTISVSAAADDPTTALGCYPPAYRALVASIVGAFLLTALLLFVSGISLSERPAAKKRYERGLNWDVYKKYLNDTSVLIPFPPQLYARLPVLLKRTIFLELPMYVFEPAKHTDNAVEAGRGSARGTGVAEERRDAPQSSERLTEES